MKQEPYAWFHYKDFTLIYHDVWQELIEGHDDWVPLYLQQKWIDLTDDEMLMIYGQKHEGIKYSLGRMVQTKLKEKNNA